MNISAAKNHNIEAFQWDTASSAFLGFFLVAAISLSLVLVFQLPDKVLLLGPQTLGIAHLIGDFAAFYLLNRRKSVPKLALFFLFLIFSYSLLGHYFQFSSFNFNFYLGLLLLLFLASESRRPSFFYICVPMVVVGFYLINQNSSWVLLLGHLHNVIALGFIYIVYGKRLGILVSSLSAFLYLGIFAGFLDSYFLGTDSLVVAMMDYEGLTFSLEYPFGERFLVAFASGQFVHYLIWIFILFSASLSIFGAGGSIRQNFKGSLLLHNRHFMMLVVVLGICTIAYLGFSYLDAHSFRDGYLQLIQFHFWMEILLLYQLFGRKNALD